jgi:ADP-ribosyl-[dinitrogen reductase] hydrolase
VKSIIPADSSQVERAEGCLLGLACGDAVGTTVEFRRRGTFPPLMDMVGGGKFRLRKGEWTDDTAMALCLAESLLARNGFDPRDQMQRYLRWANEGDNSCRPYAFGIGKTVAAALGQFTRSGDPYSGATDPRSSGNGSLMRLAPIPIFFASDYARCLDYAELGSRTTHASTECIASCRYLAHALHRGISGEREKSRLLPSHDAVSLPPGMSHIADQAFRDKRAEQIAGSGYVVESLEAALWAFWHTADFRSAVLAAANLGDDADTTAAICGQLAGAYYGIGGIPADWLASLCEGERIRGLARRLSAHAHARGESGKGVED